MQQMSTPSTTWKKTMYVRSITALTLVMVTLVALFSTHHLLLMLILGLHFGAWREFLNLRRLACSRCYSNIHDLVYGIVYITLPLILLADLRFNFIVGSVLNTNSINSSSSSSSSSSERDSCSETHNDYNRHVFTLMLFVAVWFNDAAAYGVGSLFGITPLSRVSPNKTWEGTFGGVAATIVLLTCVTSIVAPFLTFHAFCIATIVSVTGTFGDLFESALKRAAHVKDAGDILPGHGGLLDRYDSLLFAAPSTWLYVVCCT